MARVMEATQAQDNIPTWHNMKLPVSYWQFRMLIKAQAERIMRGHGRSGEYVIDENVEAIMRRIFDFTQSGSRKGIALIGKYGCGKTLLMSAYVKIHNALVDHSDGKLKRWKYKEATATQLFKHLQDNELSDTLSVPPLLIDELGREPISGKHFGTEEVPVVNLLFERWNRGALTHCTSNLTLEALSDNDHYGAMLGSRLADMFDFVVMNGPDRRR